eukprot:TRINITY_DN64_c0_g4_i1.p1 TRINITY_DN64_c0_g4~~TRINITY_DN64_c0_g4_i1.p1  ORF type:complete len:591 (+),score=245.77 TRINITY_DN64_c0_g4_i1:128-1900(+)
MKSFVSPTTGIKYYQISAAKSLPQWLSEKKRKEKQLKKDREYETRIELLQGFNFPEASQKIYTSPDGQFLAASGVYKPQLKMFEVDQLSVKFERFVDCEILQFNFLSTDYSKIAYLQADRTIELHARFGAYYKLRIPKFGRDMMYDNESCELYACGAGSEIYRFNLEHGCFSTPLTTKFESLNVCSRESFGRGAHGLLGFGGDEGSLIFYDPRASDKEISIIDIKPHLNNLDNDAYQITSLQIGGDNNGLGMITGTLGGSILVYDVRSSKPIIVKEHQNDLKIVYNSFHNTETTYVVSADPKVLKIWERDTGKILASIEPKADINHVCIYNIDAQNSANRIGQTSGLIFLAGEQSDIETYYIPALGPAPHWCSWIDNFTEELEETYEQSKIIYDDFKFVEEKEIEKLGLSHLVGSPYLKAYMHGYFVEMPLYSKMVAKLKKKEQEQKELQQQQEQQQKQQKQQKQTSNLNKDQSLIFTDKGKQTHQQKQQESKDIIQSHAQSMVVLNDDLTKLTKKTKNVIENFELVNTNKSKSNDQIKKEPKLYELKELSSEKQKRAEKVPLELRLLKQKSNSNATGLAKQITFDIKKK